MQVWIDYIAATVIAGMLLFVLFAVQLRSQDATIDAIQYRAAKQGMLSLVEMIEQDFKNIGSQRTDLALSPDTAISWPDTVVVGVDTTYGIAFWAQTDPAAPSARVRYEWRKMDGKIITLRDGTQLPLYEVQRLVNHVLTGMSTNMVTDFSVFLRNEASLPVINTKDTREIVVGVVAVSPLGRGSYVEQTRFNASFRPVNMTRRD